MEWHYVVEVLVGVLLSSVSGGVMAILIVDRLRRDVHDLKSSKPVTASECRERRANINEMNKDKFENGEKQFAEIKAMLQQILSHILGNGRLG